MNLDNGAEKRQYPRACFDWPVTLISDHGTTIVGRVRDISRGGVLVHTGTGLQIDEQVRLAIEISDFDDVISAKGKVVRTLLLDEQRSSPTYALGICFSEMSAEDYRYFTGNLAPEWQELVTGGERQGKLDMSDQKGKKGDISKLPRWVIGFISIAGLALVAIVFFQSFPRNPSAVLEKADHQDDLRLLSERMSQEIESVRKSYQQLSTTLTQLEKRLARVENSTIPSGQIEELRGLLASQTRELQQIKSRLKNQPVDRKEISVTASSRKRAVTREPLAYHTVRHGETIFSISRQHGMTINELLQLNNLPKGTIIYSNQKLRINPSSLNFQTD